MANVVSDLDIAWLAGLLEGEGCFTTSCQNGNTYPTPRLQLSMTDKDVVERVAFILKTNTTSTDWRTKGDKEIFRTSLARKEDLYEILKEIYPYMGQRRQEKINELLEILGGSDSKRST